MVETRSSTSSSKGRFWTSFLAFVAGLVVLDVGFAALIEKSSSPDYRQTVASKSDFRTDRPYDLWILGDSLAVDGVAPSVIQSEAGLTTYDWGLYASSPFEWNVLLSDLKRRSEIPKKIVIVCHPNMFIKRPNDGPFARAAIRSTDLQFSLLRGSVERSDLSAIFASGRRRLMLKGALALATRSKKSGTASPVETDNGHLVHWQGLETIPHLMIDALKFDEKNAKFQGAAFDDLVATCVGQGAQVFLAKIVVSTQQLQDYESDKPTFDNYERTLREISERYSLSVYESQSEQISATYSPQDFTDAIHLSQHGAIKFTTGLARWLRVR